MNRENSLVLGNRHPIITPVQSEEIGDVGYLAEEPELKAGGVPSVGDFSSVRAEAGIDGPGRERSVGCESDLSERSKIRFNVQGGTCVKGDVRAAGLDGPWTIRVCGVNREGDVADLRSVCWELPTKVSESLVSVSFVSVERDQD